jgi:hypothetical protein
MTTKHWGWCISRECYLAIKHRLDFSFIISAPLPAWRNLFSARGDLLGGRYPASLSLFLKVEKISALLTREKDLSSTGPFVNFDVFPRPPSLRHRSQITGGPLLRPFSYTYGSQSKQSLTILRMGQWKLEGSFSYLFTTNTSGTWNLIWFYSQTIFLSTVGPCVFRLAIF